MNDSQISVSRKNYSWLVSIFLLVLVFIFFALMRTAYTWGVCNERVGINSNIYYQGNKEEWKNNYHTCFSQTIFLGTNQQSN
jgi:hypothetical protein